MFNRSVNFYNQIITFNIDKMVLKVKMTKFKNNNYSACEAGILKISSVGF